MTVLKIAISELDKGQRRQLDVYEVAQLKKAGLRVYRGKQWQIERNDDGAYSVRWQTKKDGGATWALEQA